MWKKTISFLLAGVISAGLLVGCGNTSEGSSGGTGEKTTISFSFWEPGVNREMETAFTEIVKKYEEVRPDIEVELMAQPYSGYQEWLKSQMASDSLPTIIYNDKTYLVDMNVGNMIYRLENALDQENPYSGKAWKDDFIPEKLDLSDDEEGELGLAIPISALGLAFYYNKDIYEENNLTVPTTWDEFLANCEVIKQAGINPIAFMAQKKDAVNWLQWAICTGAFGEAFLADQTINVNQDNTITEKELARAVDTGAYDISQPGQYQDFYKQYLEYVKEFTQYCENASGLDESGAKSQFLTGAAAHIYSGSWDIKSFLLDGQAPFEVGVMPFPEFTKENSPYAGPGMTIPSVSCLSVTKSPDQTETTTKEQAAAVDFLQFVTSPDIYKIFVENTNAIPTVQNVPVDDVYDVFNAGTRSPIMFFAMEGPKSAFGNYEATLMTMIDDQSKSMDQILTEVQQGNIEAAQEIMSRYDMSKENNYGDLESEAKSGGDYVPAP